MLGRAHILFSTLFAMMVLALLATIPVWPYSRAWGYYPSGGVVAVAILLMLGIATGLGRDGSRRGGLLDETHLRNGSTRRGWARRL